jgi:glycosyltransferase involved in cell wall biosynthesis
MRDVDVCLVIEGSYPYVTGGVSSWVHRLIQGLDDVRFGIVEVLPDPKYKLVPRYEIPSNVVFRQQVYLFDTQPSRRRFVEPGPELMDRLAHMHQLPQASRCPFVKTLDQLARKAGLGAFQFETARGTWRFLTESYRKKGDDISFIDYLWSWRATHGPMLRLMELELPSARIYHALSTGYAGFVAALARMRHAETLILTEHGIYTRERDIEIAQSGWIHDERDESERWAAEEPRFKRWWRRQYQFLGTLTYETADHIIALNQVSHNLQIQAGADPTRCMIVPNGVNVRRLRDLRAPRDWQDRPFRVGFIGRVVPIKDVKTFIRAIALASIQMPLEAFVIGPLDEDPDYAQECVELVRLLGMTTQMTFVGSADVRQWLPRLDLIVLTSVSEAQPLVLLEAMAAGIPGVATRVGGCAELMEGGTASDRQRGPSGILTTVASPDATAAAICDMARHPARYQAMANAGIQRVESSYDETKLFDAYRGLYQQARAMQRKKGIS